MNRAQATASDGAFFTDHGADHGPVPLYSLLNLSKEYPGPVEKVRILQAISLDIQEGESVAIMGASGSGKSTLLHILGSLTSPSSGKLLFCGRDITALKETERAALRNAEIGFVFQFHHLLPEFSTLENVAMPAIIGGMPRARALVLAREGLARVGLNKRADFNVSLLSGGERQRAAIARAILRRPKILLADEPTGNLDEKNGRMVAELLMELHANHNMSMILVTHNPELASHMGKCFELKSGDLYEQTR